MAIGRIPEPGTGIPESIIAAKGDILTGTANDTPAVLSVGTNGHTLVANSATATGLEWKVDPVADLVTTAGDTLYATAADTLARLAIGTAGQVLQVNSGATAPEWATPASGGMTVIASGSFPNNTTTFTFSSIPTTYKYLILQLQSLNSSNNNANLSIRLGSGTTNHYGAYTLYSANNGNANNVYTNNSGSITAINAYQMSGQIIFPAYQGFSGNKMPVSWNLIGTVLDNNNFMTSIGGGFVDGLSSYTQFSLLFGFNFSGSYQLLGVN
jgi:hypothetical protein